MVCTFNTKPKSVLPKKQDRSRPENPQQSLIGQGIGPLFGICRPFCRPFGRCALQEKNRENRSSRKKYGIIRMENPVVLNPSHKAKKKKDY